MWPGYFDPPGFTNIEDHVEHHGGGHLGCDLDGNDCNGEPGTPHEMLRINPDQAVTRRSALIADLKAKRKEERAANRLYDDSRCVRGDGLTSQGGSGPVRSSSR